MEEIMNIMRHRRSVRVYNSAAISEIVNIRI